MSNKKHRLRLSIHITPDRQCTLEHPLYAVRMLYGPKELIKPTHGLLTFKEALLTARRLLIEYNSVNQTDIPLSCIKGGDSNDYPGVPKLAEVVKNDPTFEECMNSGIAEYKRELFPITQRQKDSRPERERKDENNEL